MNTAHTIRSIQDNIALVIKGKTHVIEMAVVCLLARGHLLLEDVPGVGKTTLAHSLARSIDCSFKRIQFTSDLLPSDIVGVSMFNRQKQGFEFIPGPIFANVVLADEINRTTPKTQSSLLEAMSEAQISVDNQTHPLEQPFMVIATQNPAEYHGTFPLPESQLDRFLMRLCIGYPALEEERKVLKRPHSLHPAETLEAVLSAHEVLALQARVDKVHMEESLTDYLLAIVQATRQSVWCSTSSKPFPSLSSRMWYNSRTITQDAQKVRSAKPQRVKAGGVPLGCVESLDDTRTKLVDFFSILPPGQLNERPA